MRRDPIAYARSVGVQIGERCLLHGVRPWTFGAEPYLIRIGDHVEVTAGVRFITHDGGVWVFREEDPDLDVFAPIVVGNNVFLGNDAIVMPGVTIGDDCVIGAGAVVTRDIPARQVAVGVPCKPIKTLDEYRKQVEAVAVRLRTDYRHSGQRDQMFSEKRRLLESHFPRR